MFNAIHQTPFLTTAHETTELYSTSPVSTLNKEFDFRDQEYEEFPVEYASERTKFLWNRIRNAAFIIARLNLMSKDIQTYGSTRQCFKNVDEDIITQKTPKFLFHPYGKFKLTWNFVMILLMLYTGFITPYITCFIDNISEPLFYTEISVSILFFLDTIFTFNSAYFNRAEMLIVNRKDIAKKYIKTWFIVDIVSILPFDLITGNYSGGLTNILKVSRLYKLFRLIRLMKMMRFAKSRAFLDEFIDKLKLSSGFISMCKFMFIVLVTVHIIGCFWYYIAKLEDFTPESWIVRSNLIDGSNFEKYIASIYFVFTTLTTVGYGDITPLNNDEKIFAMFLMAFGITFFSHIIGNIQNILNQKDISELSLRTRIQSLQEFTRIAKIPPELHQRIKTTILKTHLQNVSRWSDQENLLKNIPARLRVEISTHLNTRIVERIYFFKNKEHLFLSFVVPKLKTAHLLFREFLYREGDYAEEMYFLDIGRVHIKAINGITFWTYSSGAYFGEVELINEISREHTVQVSSKSTDLLILSKPDFLKMLKNFPQEEKEIKETSAIRKMKLEVAKSHVLDLALPHLNLEQINEDYEEKCSIDMTHGLERGTTRTEMLSDLTRIEKKNFTQLWSDAIKGKNVKEQWIFPNNSLSSPSSSFYTKRNFLFKKVNKKKKKTKAEWLNEQGIEEILYGLYKNPSAETFHEIKETGGARENAANTNKDEEEEIQSNLQNITNNQLLFMQNIDTLMELLKIEHGS
ncbi:unnamed protein product [Blepharisma stoltei]|uniref:Cyclic nucleotide-binding domain-containing protein n=1 Tax=Blepharisma stoltei TaxID=1481888 RepID=A0AAU9IA78_9CILI|nr:unnamed protein product [Blepharisma stoltei]